MLGFLGRDRPAVKDLKVEIRVGLVVIDLQGAPLPPCWMALLIRFRKTLLRASLSPLTHPRWEGRKSR